MTDKPLDPIEEREIEFQGDSVLAVLVSDDDGGAPAVYVPLRPMCERLGLSWSGQRERIGRDTVLSEVLQGVRVTRPPGSGGGTQTALCLPLDYLNGWLFGITASRVKEAVREPLIRYQRECYHVLADAFREDTAEALGLPEGTPLAAREAHDARVGVLAIMDYLGRRQDHDESMRKLLVANRIDLHELGGLLEDGDALTETQRRELYRLVLEVAALLSQAGDTRNTFAIAFGGFKKRFKLGKKQKYRDLDRSQYRDAHEFLDHWKVTLQGQIRKQGEDPCIV